MTTRYFHTDNLGSIAVITDELAPWWSVTYTVTTQVYFYDATRTTYAILDLVASSGGVPQFGMEIKTLAFDPGINVTSVDIDQLYTDRQSIVYPNIRAGTAIPFGGNASNAGFTLDLPIGRQFGIIDVIIPGRGMH